MSSRSSHPHEMTDGISRQLRAMYDKVLCEPLPPRFSELLKSLETDTLALSVGAMSASAPSGPARRASAGKSARHRSN
jgi:hypothetical protein